MEPPSTPFSFKKFTVKCVLINLFGKIDFKISYVEVNTFFLSIINSEKKVKLN